MSSPFGNRGEQGFSLSEKSQQQLGLPQGFKWFSPFPFAGLNQQDSAIAIDDKESWWTENYIRLGNGYMRCLWDNGLPLYTAPTGKTIIYFFWYTINSATYCAVFLNDGTAIQVDTVGNTATISNTTGQFYKPGGYLPYAIQWGSIYLVISNNNTADDYWIWNGTVLFSAGSLSPEITITSAGSGYTSAPNVTAYGGEGTGATFIATISGGSVDQIVVVNPGSGYQPGDEVILGFSGGGSADSAVLQAVISGGSLQSIVVTDGGSGYTGTPTVSFSGGGGSGAAAVAIVTNQIVTAINITNPGTGYTSTPTVSFSSGGGSGAAALAVLNPGAVSSVTVVNGGSEFSGTPTLTFVGGGGSGAVATAVMAGGSIASVTVSNGGTGYTSAPAVVVEVGQNTAAAATVTLMPFGVNGTAMETYQSRLWIYNPFQNGPQPTSGDFQVSAPQSVSDFATSDGGLLFENTNRYLRQSWVVAKQSNGFLYNIGDSSVDVVSNVQTSGSPPSTTFNDLNTDPQTGTPWRDSIQDFGRTEIFANQFGIFGMYGGAVTKISGKLDQLFAAAPFPVGLIPTPGSNPLTPTSAVANIYGIKCYFLLMTIADPFANGANRNVMFLWNDKEWFVASQTAALQFIGTREIQSNLTAWGTDGSTLFQMFSTPSSDLPKTYRSKMYGMPMSFVTKSTLGFYLQATDFTNEGLIFDATLEGWGVQTSDTGPVPVTTFPMPQINISANYPTAPLYAAAAASDYAETAEVSDYAFVYGQHLGFLLTSNSPNFALYNAGLSYRDEIGVS